MPKEIWKFKLDLDGPNRLSIPGDARVLGVGLQGIEPVVWAICDPYQPHRMHELQVVLTGRPISNRVNAGRFVGTCQIETAGGLLVVHVFDTTLVPAA